MRVEWAIAELGYTPPIIAKGWPQRNMRAVGVLIPDITNLYYPIVVKVLEDELWKNEFNIYLCNTGENIEREKSYITSLLKKGVAGMIFLGTRPTSGTNNHITELSEKMPVLLMNDYLIGANVYSVMADEIEGAYKATVYLLQLGHERIGFINGGVSFTTYQYKFEGYKRALQDHGIEIRQELIVDIDPHEEGGYVGTNKLLRIKNPPTAIFAASDQIAIGAIRACYEAGKKIPRDISVIGFSNIPIAASLYPPLTTVDQFPQKTAKIAADMIVKLIKKESLAQKRIILDPKIEIRSSCASPK